MLALAVGHDPRGVHGRSDFRRPEPPATGRYTETPIPEQTAAAPVKGGEAQRFVAGGDLPAQWWKLFNSGPLDQLVRDALAGNPTLAAAQATLTVARENLIAERGALLLPSVDGNLSATRQKITGASFGQPGAPSSIFSLYNASVNVSYALDAFGGNRRELEGLQALVDYQSFQLEGARLSLTANVVTTAIREAQLRSQLKLRRKSSLRRKSRFALIERQFELGGVGRLTVSTQRTQVEQTRALLPPLERELAQTRHQLAVLSGRLPSEAELPEFDLDAITLPQELPVSIPSSLTRQRPDVQAAEALLHQASAQIGVATANEYPKINLTGSFGSQALQLHSLFGDPRSGASAPACCSRCSTAASSKRAAARRSLLTIRRMRNYRQTVLLAFQNVADALRALEADARQLKSRASATAFARETLELTQRQYQLGGTGIIALFIAQQQYQQERLNLVAAQSLRYADTAALFQALGGGWWNADAQARPSADSKVQ
jgi:NodT family efflux transporter outer membrane factor (OMF) lipoprotein